MPVVMVRAIDLDRLHVGRKQVASQLDTIGVHAFHTGLLTLDLAAGAAGPRQGHLPDAVEVGVFADPVGPEPG